MASIRLLIVDDHPVFRQGLRDVLETDFRFEVIGEAADGAVALEKAQLTSPDVVLLDVNLPTTNGLQVTKQLKLTLPAVRVLVITGYDERAQAVHAFNAGADGFCSKDLPPESLIRVIHAVNSGQYAVDDQLMNESELAEWLEQHQRGTGNQGANGPNVPLSPREMEILELVSQGMGNKQIAQELGISHQTVKNHMTAIFRKLRVGDRTQAALFALRHGWTRLDSTG